MKESRKSELMNLIGYGMAKFDMDFVKEFSQPNRSAFARYIVQLGIASSERAVTNQRDSFDPYFDNGRRGWFQRNQREHIKLYIDSLFGNANAHEYANIVKMYIKELDSNIQLDVEYVSPIQKSRFKQLQETGKEAEFYFLNNYQRIPLFTDGAIEDARLWGDGYDFQVQCGDKYYLAEIKGVQTARGSIRLTQNEYNKANEYKNDYILVVISSLITTPKLSYFANPANHISLVAKTITTNQINYYSDSIIW